MIAYKTVRAQKQVQNALKLNRNSLSGCIRFAYEPGIASSPIAAVYLAGGALFRRF